MKQYNNLTIQRGFTLIEILVAVAVFSLVIASISGIFVSVLQSQRKALASQALIDGISYNLEYISRALRMARKQTIDLPACLSQSGLNYEITQGGQGIKFLNYQGICYEFYLNGTRLFQNKGGEILPITSQNLEVSSVKFNPSGQSEIDNLQPRATISFYIKSKGQRPEEKTEIRVQTTVSQRELDTR
jgi:prepilin-type N-terminal cleavage/methylation domain-containing protein